MKKTPDPLVHPVRRGALVAGTLASVFSTVALLKNPRALGLAPVNAISHWYWGDSAFHRRKGDFRHTVLGYLTHHGASIFWSTLLICKLEKAKKPPSPATIIASSAATSALACFVDFKLTPQRLTPGFEHEIDKAAIARVYFAFAAGMALGALFTHGPWARGSTEASGPRALEGHGRTAGSTDEQT